MTAPEGGPGLPAESDKPAILYLDVDDEITSAAGRVRTSPEGAVAIVLPHGSRLATSRINFRLLAREAAKRGRRLSIVTPDASARALAASAGLPVFASVSEFESAAAHGIGLVPSEVPPASPARVDVPATRAASPPAASLAPSAAPPGESPWVSPPSAPDAWSQPASEATSPRSGGSIPVVGRRARAVGPSRRGTLSLLVLAGIALVAGVGAFTVLPNATIVVSPRLEAIGPIRMEIVADPGATATDPTSGVIPAERITIEVTASDTFSATGKRVETTKATGSVTFQSCDTGRSRTVTAGAVVSTAEGVKFATVAAVTVPRATIFPFACKTAAVRVAAVADGPESNVAAGTITRIPPGYDSVVLSVTNPAATTGGLATEFAIVLQADFDAALDVLKVKARSDFIARVADPAQVPVGMEVFDETAVLTDPVWTVDPATLVGTEVATFDLAVSATGSVIAVDAEPIRALAEARMVATIVAPDRLVDGSIEIVVGAPTVDGELIRFPVTAQASTVRDIDGDELKAQVLGLPLRDARAVLERAGVVEIEVWPEWVTAIPGIDARVTLTVGEAEAAL